MRTLAPLLADLNLFPAVTKVHRECGKKYPYASMDAATKAALHRQDLCGALLFAYPCPHAVEGDEHWHLTSRPQTAAQLDALTTFVMPKQREILLLLRTLRREADQAQRQMAILASRLRMKSRAGPQGLPVPSAIQEHFAALRRLLEQWRDQVVRSLAAAYAYDRQAIALEACKEFSSPSSAWRETVEARVADLAEAAVSQGHAAEERYTETMGDLAVHEEEMLSRWRVTLSERYGQADEAR